MALHILLIWASTQSNWTKGKPYFLHFTDKKKKTEALRIERSIHQRYSRSYSHLSSLSYKGGHNYFLICIYFFLIWKASLTLFPWLILTQEVFKEMSVLIPLTPVTLFRLGFPCSVFCFGWPGISPKLHFSFLQSLCPVNRASTPAAAPVFRPRRNILLLPRAALVTGHWPEMRLKILIISDFVIFPLTCSSFLSFCFSIHHLPSLPHWVTSVQRWDSFPVLSWATTQPCLIIVNQMFVLATGPDQNTQSS